MSSIRYFVNAFFGAVRVLVCAMAVLSGASILVMIAITCADVILREFGSPIVGALDIVTTAGAIAIAAGLPYTTAVKGHVAIEYFFHKLLRRGRIVVDSVIRVIAIALFIILCIGCVRYGIRLEESNSVSPTLELPIFWIAHVLASSFGVTVLVILYNLLHPGKELIKP